MMKIFKIKEIIMQHNHMNRYEKIILGVKGFLWVAGLIMAGSDSNFMPWGNGIGVFLFAVSSFSLGRRTVMIPSKNKAAGCPGFYRKSDERHKQRLSFFIPAANL
jgi:hypothetical protein